MAKMAGPLKRGQPLYKGPEFHCETAWVAMNEHVVSRLSSPSSPSSSSVLSLCLVPLQVWL